MKQMKLTPSRSLAVLILLMCMSAAHAQDSLSHAFTFSYQNDFFNATDRYLTQDVTIAYQAPFIQRLPTSRVLLRLKDNVFPYQKDSVLQKQLLYLKQCSRFGIMFFKEAH